MDRVFAGVGCRRHRNTVPRGKPGSGIEWRWPRRPSEAARIATGLRFRAIWAIIALVALIAASVALFQWADGLTAALAGNDMVKFSLLAALLIAYVLLISIPFVPGVEIGLSLLALQGASIAPAVYLATVLGLMLAFSAGHRIPSAWIVAALERLRMRKATRFVETLAGQSGEERLARLQAAMPSWAGQAALRYRYVGLALLINLPGSSLIGGGGGICLLAGMAGVFSLRGTALTIALAVAPVPLLTWWLGWAPFG